MVTNEVALTTRTGLVFPEVTRTAAGIPTIVLREPDLLETAESEPPRAGLRDSLPPQPLTAQVTMPPTVMMPAPQALRPTREGVWRERVIGGAITATVLGAIWAAPSLFQGKDDVVRVGEVPATGPPATTPVAVPSARAASPSVSRAEVAPPARSTPPRPSPRPTHDAEVRVPSSVAPSASPHADTGGPEALVLTAAHSALKALQRSTDPRGDGTLGSLLEVVDGARAIVPSDRWDRVADLRELVAGGSVEKAPELVAELEKALRR
jgi:hypothetical protein